MVEKLFKIAPLLLLVNFFGSDRSLALETHSAKPKSSASACLQQFKIPSMGTLFEIQLGGPCDLVAEPLIKGSQEILKTWESEFSLYQPRSPISLLNRQGFLEKPSPIFIEGIERSLRYSQLTLGQFNILVEPLLNEIRQSFTNRHQPPDLATLDQMKPLLNSQNILKTENQIAFSVSGAQVTLDGIVKGIAVDKLAELAESLGFENYLLNFSGNMRWKGHPPHKKRWKLQAWNPVKRKSFEIQAPLNGAMASSGPEHNSFDEKYIWHHLMSPQTLRPAQDWSQTTIIGKSAADCDALSTATFVSDDKMIQKILVNFPGYQAYAIDRRGRKRFFLPR